MRLSCCHAEFRGTHHAPRRKDPERPRKRRVRKSEAVVMPLGARASRHRHAQSCGQGCVGQVSRQARRLAPPPDRSSSLPRADGSCRARSGRSHFLSAVFALATLVGFVAAIDTVTLEGDLIVLSAAPPGPVVVGSRHRGQRGGAGRPLPSTPCPSSSSVTYPSIAVTGKPAMSMIFSAFVVGQGPGRRR